MDFTQSLLNYYRGERLEAVLLAAFGVVAAGLTIMLWRHADQNALAKGLFFPIAFLTALTLSTGGYGAYNNNHRLARFPVQYAENPAEFVQAEQARFEGAGGINSWWLPLKTLWAGLVIAGMLGAFLLRSDLMHGIAIGLICIGGMGFLIDGFAHHRAKKYTSAILAHGTNQP